MSEKKDGGPAFPVIDEYNNIQAHGMTLRDYFAGQALEGFLSGVAGLPSMDEVYEHGLDRVFREHAEKVAQTMYAYADAMIAERER